MTIKMKKIVFYTLLILIPIVGYIYLCLNPIILHDDYPQYAFPPDTVYNPLKNVDFTKGNNKIIIYTNREDVSFLPHSIKKFTLIECTNNKTIEQFKNAFYFKKVSNDFVETTNYDSRIFIFQNKKLIFTSEFMIDETVSLQFMNTGWTFSTNYEELRNCISTFSPCYFPIIII